MNLLRWIAISIGLWLVACDGVDAPNPSASKLSHAELMKPLLLADNATQLDPCLTENPPLDKCRENQALHQGDVGRCFDIDSPHRTIRCLRKLRKGPTPPIPTRRQCETLSPLQLASECTAIRAVGLGNRALCEDYSDWGRNHCLSVFAQESENAASCAAIKHDGMRGQCQLDLAKKLGPGVCENAPPTLSARCIRAAFEGRYLTDFHRLSKRSQQQVAGGAIDICITSSSMTARRHCTQKLVSLTGDLSLCKRGEVSAYDIQHCVRNTTAPLICDELERGLVKDNCIVEGLLSARNRGPSQSAPRRSPSTQLSCGLVQDKSLRSTCEAFSR